MTASRSLRLLALAAVSLIGWPVPPSAARSGGIGEIVMSVCLTAFESEMAQAGKRAPAGMANYACACVVDQISSGQTIDAARNSCKVATSRRYPI